MRLILFCLLINWAAAAEIYYVDPQSQRGDNGMMVFRDADEELWPVFMRAHANETRTFTLDKHGLPSKGFAIANLQVVQANGEQDRRIIGELVTSGEAPVVQFRIDRVGTSPAQKANSEKNSKKKRPPVSTAFTGMLTVNERVLQVQGTLTMSESKVDGISGIVQRAHFMVHGKDIGLKQHADKMVVCQFSALGADQETKDRAAGKRRKKKKK